jgi:hypothetical protein
MAERAERMGTNFLNEIYRDSQGNIRWRSNHLVVPTNILQEAEASPYGSVMNETPSLSGQRSRMTASSEGVHNEFNPDYERGKKKMNASLAETLVKTARILCEEDHVNADSTLQIMVGDPNDSRTSTFVQFKPNPGSMQLPNPLSPIEGDEIFFAYLIPGAIFQAHDGTEWWIDSYTAPDEISISNRWYPRINAFVSIDDIRRSIHQWVEPITQTVPPPPPGVDYSALPVRIVDGPGRPDENIGIGGGAGINGGW